MKIDIHWDPAVQPEWGTPEMEDLSARIGWAVTSLTKTRLDLLPEWPEEEYGPTEATIEVVPMDSDLFYLRDSDDPLFGYAPTEPERQYLVISWAPSWFGEGSGSAILRKEDGSLFVDL